MSSGAALTLESSIHNLPWPWGEVPSFFCASANCFSDGGTTPIGKDSVNSRSRLASRLQSAQLEHEIEFERRFVDDVLGCVSIGWKQV